MLQFREWCVIVLGMIMMCINLETGVFQSRYHCVTIVELVGNKFQDLI